MANDSRFINFKAIVRDMSVLTSDNIWVDSDWVDRELYYIRLQHNETSDSSVFSVCVAYYEIRLNLKHVPPEFFLEALHFIFTEIFFIMRYNSATTQGRHRIRMVLTADSLENSINLKSIDTNDEIDSERLLLELEKVLQSHETLLTDDSLVIMFCSCRLNY